MENHQTLHPPHIFTLRLWQEELAAGETEWRLQLRSVETGQTHYFRDWPSLVGLLLVMLPSTDGGSQTNRETTGNSPEGER